MSQITLRDKNVLYFLQKFHIALSSQIADICYEEKYAVARRRLNTLVEAGLVHRESQGKEYIYWIKEKPEGRIDHLLMVVDIYIKLNSFPGKIEEFLVEPDFQGLKPDAYCKFISASHETQFYVCFEVERLAINKFDQAAYENFFTSRKWIGISPVFPKIVIVTDNNRFTLAESLIEFFVLPSNLYGIEKIFD